MGGAVSVIDLDVINAMASSDPEIRCVTIRDQDVRCIQIEHEGIKTNNCKNIVDVISRFDYLRKVIITKSLTAAEHTQQLVTTLNLRGLWLELIDLSESAINDEAAEQLRVIVVRQKVARLRLRKCNMTPRQISLLLQGFRESRRRPSELDITGNKMVPQLVLYNQDTLFNNPALKWTRWMGEDEPRCGKCINNAGY